MCKDVLSFGSKRPHTGSEQHPYTRWKVL